MKETPTQTILILVVLLLVLTLMVSLFISLRKRGRGLGYEGPFEYLRAIPATDEQRRDGIDLALQGLVTCLLGVLLPLLLLVGLVPLYYGGRKVLASWLGVGLDMESGQGGSYSTNR